MPRQHWFIQVFKDNTVLTFDNIKTEKEAKRAYRGAKVSYPKSIVALWHCDDVTGVVSRRNYRIPGFKGWFMVWYPMIILLMLSTIPFFLMCIQLAFK